MGGCVKILSEGDCFLTFALWVSQADRFPSSYGTVLLLPDWWCTVSHFLFDPLPPLADILSRSENNKHFVRLSSCLVRMYSTVDVYLNSSPPHQCSLCQIVTQVRACLTGLKAEIFSQPISYASHPSKYVLFFGAQHLLSDESNRRAPRECVSAAAAQSHSLPPSLHPGSASWGQMQVAAIKDELLTLIPGWGASLCPTDIRHNEQVSLGTIFSRHGASF